MNRDQFYKSDKWEKFRRIIINERTDADGFVHCAICGKPILKKYDLIVHHIDELDDLNVDDVNVALNPDNVQCVHFKCHNQVHERFGYNKTSVHKQIQKQVYIVYGAPCSGKTTWVNEVATKDDLIVDLDSIWQMISINDRYQKPDALKSVVFDIRDKLYDIIKYRSGNWHNAYIITGGALIGDRERLKQRLNANDLVFIDTKKEDCLARVRDKYSDGLVRAKWYEYIIDWFDRYQPS
jgi:shikimate kinase